VIGALVLALSGSQALALSLGRVVVQSALGEPLRAEIDFLDITAEEAVSLRTSVASPEAFRAAGLSYNASVVGLQASLQKRADGRLYIRLSSAFAITDSFFDLLLEASWASGRILRDYTLLFAPAKAGATQTDSGTGTAVSNDNTKGRARQVEGGKVKVSAGDTASEIALALKPSNVSLDQMLVALLRANPGVFQGDNVNRIQAGAVLNLPGDLQASETARSEATRIIAAQSRDFNEFRRKFAGIAPQAQVEGASRQTSGKVKAKVEDKPAAQGAADKLRLAKGNVQESPPEEQFAKERSAREAASRADELARNIVELNKLGASTQAAASSQPASSASSPIAPAVTNPLPADPSASAPAIAPTAAGSAPASAPKTPASATSTPIKSQFIDRLVDHPLVPWGAGALITALASILAYRIGRRRQDSTDAALDEKRSLDAFIVSRQDDAQETVFAPNRPSVQPMFEPSRSGEELLAREETLYVEQSPALDEPEPEPEAEPKDLDVDFSLDDEPQQTETPGELSPNELDLEFDLSEPEAETPTAPPATAPEPLPLDLGSLSLDLGEEFQDSKTNLTDLSDDPLETKLDLAEEFRAIGDEDGARALIEEVIESASGEMKARAERALGKLK
jgi:pilus assembly protein FimV